MSIIVSGLVRAGVVVPASPLPEGVRVEIVVPTTPEIPPELKAEFEAWDQASARALALVDEMASQDEKR